jgi:hypothetical protein
MKNLILLLFILCFCASAQQVEVIIGTDTTSSYYGPIYTGQYYSVHEAIYRQSEIGVAGTITHIAYYKHHEIETHSIIENVTIYMKYTTDSMLTTGNYSMTDYIQVYHGSFPNDEPSSLGWKEVQLSDPFQYYNTCNLQILVLRTYPPLLYGWYVYYRYTTTSPTYRTRQAASFNSQPTNLIQTYNRPNIRFKLNTPLLTNDVGIEAIITPSNTHNVNTPMIPIAKVRNYGTATQNNFQVTCSIFGTNSILRYTNVKIITSLTAMETTWVTFDAWTPTNIEEQTIAIRTRLLSDENLDNDRKAQTTQVVLFRLKETFADTTFPPVGWTRYNFDGGSQVWFRYSFLHVSPPACAACYYEYTPIYNNDWLITPRFGPLGSGDSLIFYFRAQITSYYYETLLIRVSTIANVADTAQYITIDLISTNNQIWQRRALSLAPFSYNQVYIAFQYNCFHQMQINIDDVEVRGYDLSVYDNLLDNITTTTLNPIKPNPAINGKSNISFNLVQADRVTLKIYDASGRIVRNLVDEFMGSGVYNVAWNGKDENNRKVAEGIYFCTLETPKQKFTKKLVFTK